MRRITSCRCSYYVLFLLLLSNNMLLRSQVVTIGGTGSPGVWEISPFYIFSSSRIRTQYLYRSSDLVSAGAAAGVIDSIAFYKTPSSFFNNVGGTARGTIHATNVSSLSNSSSGGFQPLNGTGSSFSAYNLTFSTGWNKQALSLPFVWNGTDNLLFNVCTRPSSTNPSSGPAVNASVTSYGSCISGSDAVNISCSNVTATNAYLGRPVIRLYFSNRAALSVTINTNVGLCGYDGSALATAAGGYPPYSFLWSTASTSSQLIGLSSGNYSVTVTDAVNQTTSATVSLSTPPAFNVSVSRVQQVSCFGFNDGAIDISLSNGLPPYNYIWSDSSTDSNRTNLISGNYAVSITDSNGCIATSNSISVSQPLPLSLNFTRTTESCPGSADGSISATAIGGKSPYSYQWSNQSTTAALSNLSAGTYFLTVTDSLNCSFTDSIVLINPDTLNRNVVVSGNLLISAQSSVRYKWLNCRNGFSPIIGANAQFFTPPPNGIYAVELTKGICVDTSYCTPYLLTELPENTFGNIEITSHEKTLLITATPQLNETLFIYSSRGVLLHYQQIKGEVNEINLWSFKRGVYFVKVGTSMKKVMLL